MIVVTGGSGFIGSHLSARLAEDGYPVRIVDIAPPPLGTPAEYVRASVLDAARLGKAFEGADAVVHLAALIDVQASMRDPYSDFQVNAGGTLSVLEAARRAGIKRLAFASSAAVYGNPVTLPVDEKHQAVPLSPYGASKLAAERYVLLYNSAFGMKNTALRLFNVYGTGQNPQSPYSGVITKFANAIREGRRPVIYGDGGQTRDFVHVDDVCEAFVRAVESDGYGRPMNIASGEETSLNSLLAKMCTVSGKEAEPEFLKERSGDILRSVADISLAKKQLGYRPGVPLESGLSGIMRQ